MIKKTLSLLTLSTLIFISQAAAFRDVTPQSDIFEAVEYLTDNDLFPQGTFFMPTEPISQGVFYEIAIKDTDFNPESATFDTKLPLNISDDDPQAQYLREAVRRDFISPEQEFDSEKAVTRIQAIQTLVKTKAIPSYRGPTNAFLHKLKGAPKTAKYLGDVEAAYASNMLEDKDIKSLRPFAALTRADLARWLYNYEQNGTKRASINPRGTHINQPQSTAEKRRSENKRQTITIDMDQTQKYINARGLDGIDLLPNSNILKDVFKNILVKYRFSDELTDEKRESMVEAAIGAMVKEMGDKFSNYVAPEKSQEFQESINGKFEGIGAHVEMIEDDFTITAPIKDSPAFKSGILAGDIVTHVDDEDIRGLETMEIINKIKGPAGTDVTLTIQRGTLTKNITVTRGNITIPTIELTFKKGIPVISVHKFTASTQPEFEKILREEVLPKNPRGLVIDLRNDPGGLLTSAVAMGEYFTHRGMRLFSIDYKNFKRDFDAAKDGILTNQKNIVVLQNKGTASASEILASIIQEYDIGTLIGTTTLGKGTVQEIINYRTGGILKLTVAKWLTPKGNWIQEDEENPGIKPDIKVSDPTPEEIKEGVDRQLETALRHILDNR